MTEFQQAVAVSVIVFGAVGAWHFLGVYRTYHGKHLARTYWSDLSPAMKHNHNPVYLPNNLRQAKPEVQDGFRNELSRLIRTYENA